MRFGIKAISPDGQLNDVKGIKVGDGESEGTINGVEIYSHIKAIPQIE